MVAYGYFQAITFRCRKYKYVYTWLIINILYIVLLLLGTKWGRKCGKKNSKKRKSELKNCIAN